MPKAKPFNYDEKAEKWRRSQDIPPQNEDSHAGHQTLMISPVSRPAITLPPAALLPQQMSG